MPKDENSSHEKGQAPSVVVPITSKPRQRTGINKHGLTDKQEIFALAVFEGNNFSDAYREAYDTQNMNTASIHREAHALTVNPKVSARIDGLFADKEKEQRMLRLSRSEKVISKLEQVALRDGDADGTQIRALELLGKTMGLFIDKVETEDKTERTEQQLEKDIEQKLIALGIKQFNRTF